MSSTGHRAFVLVARYPANPRNPTRRALGEYGALTLEQARVKARDWLQSINKGIDPRDEEERSRALALRSRQSTFGFIAEEFLTRYVKGPSFCQLEGKAAELMKYQTKLKPSVALRRIMALPENKELVARSEKVRVG